MSIEIICENIAYVFSVVILSQRFLKLSKEFVKIGDENFSIKKKTKKIVL